MQRRDAGYSRKNHQALPANCQKGSELRACARMNGLSNGCEPFLDSRFVCDSHDICSNLLANGNGHFTRSEEAAKAFHDQLRKPKFGHT